MKEKPTFGSLFESVSHTVPYVAEGVIIEFTEQIISRLQSLKLKRTAFAERLQTTPAYVTKLLGGGTNFSVESMVKVSEALDADLRIELVPKSSRKAWGALISKASPVQKSEVGIWFQRQRQNQALESFIGPRGLPDELVPY